VIDPATRHDAIADLWIADGRIRAIAPPHTIPAQPQAIELALDGCWVTPGLCDPHVHLRDPGFPEKETIPDGLMAAASGGFVAVAAMANTAPVNDHPAVTSYMLKRAREAGGAKLVPVSAVTKGLRGLELVDFEAMARAGARMFSDDGAPVDDPELLGRALRKAHLLGFRVALHEEDRALSQGRGINAGQIAARLGLEGYPTVAESARLARDLEIALRWNAPVHIAHISAKESLDIIRGARECGLEVTCEVSPHHFTLDESAVIQWGTYAKMSPPLRSREDVAKILEGLADGTIDMIATDHAPHDDMSKEVHHFPHPPGVAPLPQPLLEHQAQAFERAANGVVGLETALGLALELVHRGVISPMRMVELMALNPARLLGLESGTLRPGAPADVTVIDPERTWQAQPWRFRSRSRNTPFSGCVFKGKAVLTIVEGQIVYDELTVGEKGA